ncbi:TonB-dependent receptor [Campylobacter jejuni]|nr:TonB-dependent receptor [Campylobacter jejuni]
MVALYGENEYFITDDLIFTTGLRYIYSNLFDSEFTPRIYLVYHLNDKPLKEVFQKAIKLLLPSS